MASDEKEKCGDEGKCDVEKKRGGRRKNGSSFPPANLRDDPLGPSFEVGRKTKR